MSVHLLISLGYMVMIIDYSDCILAFFIKWNGTYLFTHPLSSVILAILNLDS